MLNGNGIFVITHASSAFDAMAIAQERAYRFDLILVDAPLPDGGVAELCRHLRRRGVSTPIVVISAVADEDRIISALEAGAIDYLVWPVRAGELRARIRAHIREHETSEDAVLPTGNYQLTIAENALFDPATDRRVLLTAKEVGILKHLYRAGGAPVTREALLGEVWATKMGLKATLSKPTFTGCGAS